MRYHRDFLRHIEKHAGILRQRAGVGPLDTLDPRGLTEQFGLVIKDMKKLSGVAPEDQEWLSSVDAKVWSGSGLPLPGDRLLVLLHPNQTRERATVTIMEEIAHAYFGHPPSRLLMQPNGAVKREYDPQAEKEAYWTAAATLLPAQAAARAVWRRQAGEALAQHFGVSIELVEFRIKVLGLWSDYASARSNRKGN
jgi:hypothetical protein